MAKKIDSYIKLQIPAGKANPSPPVGPALGQKGVNIMEFCKQFNARTQDKDGLIIPVVITVYSDKSFTFITKTPPAAVLLKRAAKLERGSAESHRTKVGKVSKKQVKEIAEVKMPDLNAFDIDHAVSCLLYTSDAADERSSVDLGGRRIIKKKISDGQENVQIIKLRYTYTSSKR